jgi:hypothetical protein
MKIIKDIQAMSASDPRWAPCQELGVRIETELAASKDPLREAIVALIEYDGGDIEEWATCIYDVIKLLPPEVPGDIASEPKSFHP